MAYENVNVNSLKNAINSCINSLDCSRTKQIIGDLSNNNVWQSDSKKNLVNALEKLSNTRYKELKKKLKEYLNLVDDIEKYQKLEKENESLRSKNDSLNNRLYRTEKEVNETKDSNGNIVREETEKTIKDYGVANQISNNKNKIESNKEKMSSLRTRISNSI